MGKNSVHDCNFILELSWYVMNNNIDVAVYTVIV